MKIAIPTKGNEVDDHFGHCEVYTIVTLDDANQLVHTELMDSPQGCGCKSNVIPLLKEKGVQIMLAGNMGNGALNLLNQNGIEVFRGCSGTINLLIEKFQKGIVLDSGQGCGQHAHHGNEHQCNS